jgi:3'(2'), 5'-bisphosphate nucleotidase
LAEGKADLYPRFGPTSEWDTAAGQALLEAAGGHVTRLDRHRLRYNCRESVLNGDFVAFSHPSVLPDRGA